MKIYPLIILLFLQISACYQEDNSDIQQNLNEATNFSLDIKTFDSFEQENNQFLQGEIINIRTYVTNLNDTELVLNFGSYYTGDIELINQQNETVWRVNEGKAFIQIPSKWTLEPNKTYESSFNWDQKLYPNDTQVPAGTYKLIFYLVGYDQVAEMTITIE